MERPDPFVGRVDEQARFSAMLRSAAAFRKPQPDEGFVLVVHGHGGIGKSALLRQYKRIATREIKTARHTRRRFIVAATDWESERRRRPTDFAQAAGPPIWKILHQLYASLVDAVADKPRKRRRVERCFDRFRLSMIRMPQLEERARQLGLQTVVGRQKIAAEQIKPFIELGSAAGVMGLQHLAGVPGLPPAVRPGKKALTSLSNVAETAVNAAQDHRLGTVDAHAYESVVDQVDAVVHAFVDGLQQLSRSMNPVVVLLDTCELLGASVGWIRDIARRSGSRVVWVFGTRLESETDAGFDSEISRFVRDVHGRRLVLIPVTRFDDQTLRTYLENSLGVPLAADSLMRISRLTRGIPLAAHLVSGMLRGEPDLRAALERFPQPEETSDIVRGLAERYLTHVNSIPGLASDLTLLYGMALLYGGRSDEELLAALWKVNLVELPGTLSGLAARHDFVLSATRSIHEDVRATIRVRLLSASERPMVVPMNRRAQALLRSRLNKADSGFDDYVVDEASRATVISLLWHTFWVDTAAGFDLLLQIYPACDVVGSEFGAALTAVADFFKPTLSIPDRQVVRHLQFLGMGMLGRLIEERQLRPDADALPLRDGLAVTIERLSRRQAARGLSVMPALPAGAMEAFKLKHASDIETAPQRQLELFRDAARAVPGDAARTRLTVLELGFRLVCDLASRLVADKDRTDEILPEAFKIVQGWDGGDPTDWKYLGLRLSILNYPTEAAAAYSTAIALDDSDGETHIWLANVEEELGRMDRAESSYRKGIALHRRGESQEAGVAGALLSLSRVLQTSGDRHDDATALVRQAASLAPNDPSILFSAGLEDFSLQRYTDAETFLRGCLDLDGDYPEARAWLGMILARMGKFVEAAQEFKTAIETREDWFAELGFAMVMRSIGNDQAAEEHLCRSIILERPDETGAQLVLGEFLLRRGRREEATLLLRDAAAGTEERLRTTVLLGIALAPVSPAESGELFRDAATITVKSDRDRADAEARAVALFGAGLIDAARDEVRFARTARDAWDLHEGSIRDLLHDVSLRDVAQLFDDC
jgi:tetratricopeptide (TPR) repeat protein